MKVYICSIVTSKKNHPYRRTLGVFSDQTKAREIVSEEVEALNKEFAGKDFGYATMIEEFELDEEPE